MSETKKPGHKDEPRTVSITEGQVSKGDLNPDVIKGYRLLAPQGGGGESMNRKRLEEVFPLPWTVYPSEANKEGIHNAEIWDANKNRVQFISHDDLACHIVHMVNCYEEARQLIKQATTNED